MWLDLVALLILGIFAITGAVRGALKAGTALFALITGYLAAIFAAPALAPSVAGTTGVSELFALPLAGTLAFLLGYVGVALTGSVIRRVVERHDEERSPRDRFMGALFGSVRGLLVVVLLSWLALWLDAYRGTGAAVPVPEVEGSVAAKVAEKVVEAGVEAAMGDEPAGRVAARIAARPGAALADFEAVLESQSVEGLRQDQMFWTYVEHGSVDAALNRASFRRVAYDPELRSQLAGLGLVDAEAAGDPAVFRENVAAVMADVGPRIKGLRDDPEVQALVADPQVVAMLQSGDTLGLLRHPGFQDLVDRVTSQPEPDAQSVQ